MDKPKRKEKSRSKATFEFVSPFPFEECAARVPKGLIIHSGENSSVFRTFKQENRKVKLEIYLDQIDDISTLLQVDIKSNLFFQIFVSGAMWLIFGGIFFGGTPLSYLIAGVLAVANMIFTYFAVKRKNQDWAESIFEVFKPITKSKNESNAFSSLIFRLPFKFTPEVAPDVYLARIQRGNLYNLSVKIVAASDDTWRFSLEKPNKLGLQAIGRLQTEDDFTTVRGNVGINIRAYAQIFWFLLRNTIVILLFALVGLPDFLFLLLLMYVLAVPVSVIFLGVISSSRYTVIQWLKEAASVDAPYGSKAKNFPL